MRLAEIYRQCAADLAALFADASRDQLDARIPACPGWTGRELLSHVAGASSDILAGRMDDAPSPRWTGRQVCERVERTVAELTAELLGNADRVAATCFEDTGPSPAWDITVHLGDVHEAWVRPGRPLGLQIGTSAVVADALRFRVAIGPLAGAIGMDDGVVFGSAGRRRG